MTRPQTIRILFVWDTTNTTPTHMDSACAVMTRRVRLWNAINAYVIACGGDPAAHVHGNGARMNAVVKVEQIVEDVG